MDHRGHGIEGEREEEKCDYSITQRNKTKKKQTVEEERLWNWVGGEEGRISEEVWHREGVIRIYRVKIYF